MNTPRKFPPDGIAMYGGKRYRVIGYPSDSRVALDDGVGGILVVNESDLSPVPTLDTLVAETARQLRNGEWCGCSKTYSFDDYLRKFAADVRALPEDGDAL